MSHHTNSRLIFALFRAEFLVCIVAFLIIIGCSGPINNKIDRFQREKSKKGIVFRFIQYGIPYTFIHLNSKRKSMLYNHHLRNMIYISEFQKVETRKYPVVSPPFISVEGFDIEITESPGIYIINGKKSYLNIEGADYTAFEGKMQGISL